VSLRKSKGYNSEINSSNKKAGAQNGFLGTVNENIGLCPDGLERNDSSDESN
jgi:hypothetical protein